MRGGVSVSASTRHNPERSHTKVDDSEEHHRTNPGIEIVCRDTKKIRREGKIERTNESANHTLHIPPFRVKRSRVKKISKNLPPAEESHAAEDEVEGNEHQTELGLEDT